MNIFGLRTKIIGLLIILITIVMGFTTYYTINTQVSGRIEEFTEQARAVGQVIGLNYARSLLTETTIEDRQRVSTKLWKQSTSRAIYLKAYGVDGRVIHEIPEKLPERYADVPEVEPEQLKQLLESDRSYLRRWDRDADLFDILIPIRYEQNRLGVIRLGLDTQKITQAQQQIFYRNLQITGAFWIFAALIGMLATGRIIRPLESLVDSTRKLGEGDLSVRSSVDTWDEIGELGEHFNKMADQIQQRVRERERSLEQLQAIQTVGTTLNESTEPDVFFPVLDEAMQTLYDIETFIPIIQEGDIYTAPYSRPKLDSPLFIPSDSSVIEAVDREAEPFEIKPDEDWPPPLQSMNWAYPLKVGYYLNGVLFMQLGHDPTDQELSWMQIWGTQVAQAIRAMVLNRQVTEYRTQPISAVEDRLEFLVSEDFTDFGRVDLPDFVDNQREEGLFYGEDFYDQVVQALDSMDMELETVEVRRDQFLVAGSNLNTFEYSEIEDALTDTVEFNFTLSWLEETTPSAATVEQFLLE